MDLQNLVPLYIDKVTGQHIATNGASTSAAANRYAVLIDITDNGSHKHAAYLSGVQAIDLIRGALSQVVVQSTDAQGHSHNVTVTYSNNKFIVVDIDSNHMHGFLVFGNAQDTPVTTTEGFRYAQTVPAQIWTVNHNMGSTAAITQVYVNDEMVIPTRIRFVDINNIEIYFSEPVAGFSNTVFFTQS